MIHSIFSEVEGFSPFFLYYIKNEIHLRWKSAPLLWCYYGSIVLILLPSVLSVIFSASFILHYANALPLFLSCFLLFFPTSLNIFSRERQHSMLDYVVLSSTRFKMIYIARIFANACLMIFPLVLSFSGLFMFTTNQSLSIFLPFFVSLTILFFFVWYLLSSLILLLWEIYFPSSVIRVFLYYLVILVFLAFLSSLDLLDLNLIFPEVLIGSSLFTNLLISLIVIILCGLGIFWLVSKLLTIFLMRCSSFVTGGYHSVKRPSFYSKFQSLLIRHNIRWRISLSLLNFLPYFVLSFFTSNFFVVISFYCYHVGFLLFFLLIMIFPRITVEKEYNMEEMILSQISANRYFFNKVFLLLKPILFSFPFIMASITLFFPPLFFFFSLLTISSFFKALYFISLLLFVWRIFPTKDLFQSILFSIFGFEVLGFLISRFLFPGFEYLELIFSPLLSNLLLPFYLWNPQVMYIIPLHLVFNAILSVFLFLGSLVLVKSEIRYD